MRRLLSPISILSVALLPTPALAQGNSPFQGPSIDLLFAAIVIGIVLLCSLLPAGVTTWYLLRRHRSRPLEFLWWKIAGGLLLPVPVNVIGGFVALMVSADPRAPYLLVPLWPIGVIVAQVWYVRRVVRGPNRGDAAQL